MAFYGRGYAFRNLHNLDPQTIKQTLNINNLMSYEEYCKEAEAEIIKVRQEIAEQIPRLQNIKTKNYIEVERVKGYDKKVCIYVRLMTETRLDDYVRYNNTDSKTFGGNEKKQALEYAEVLRKKYGYGITKINWK